MTRLRVLFLLLLIAISLPAFSDDGAASIAAGGIVVMKREPRITMAKEVLRISTTKIIVDYDFRNDSDEDVTTEVAFPIPDYHAEDRLPSEQGFDDFHLWIEDQPAAFSTETRAFLKDKDYTDLLTGLHINIPSFGHMADLDNYPDIARLPDTQRMQLAALGLIDKSDNFPFWQNRKKYYWQQIFPAHKTIHIRHEYTPALGSHNGLRYAWDPTPDKLTLSDLKSMCVDDPLYSKLKSIPGAQDGGYLYVDFILTTANTWKTPIEDFTLIVEKPHTKNFRGKPETGYVSFCWDGPVSKIDADHFSAHIKNLVPAKELRVGFISIQPPKN